VSGGSDGGGSTMGVDEDEDVVALKREVYRGGEVLKGDVGGVVSSSSSSSSSSLSVHSLSSSSPSPLLLLLLLLLLLVLLTLLLSLSLLLLLLSLYRWTVGRRSLS